MNAEVREGAKEENSRVRRTNRQLVTTVEFGRRWGRPGNLELFGRLQSTALQAVGVEGEALVAPHGVP